MHAWLVVPFIWFVMHIFEGLLVHNMYVVQITDKIRMNDENRHFTSLKRLFE